MRELCDNIFLRRWNMQTVVDKKLLKRFIEGIRSNEIQQKNPIKILNCLEMWEMRAHNCCAEMFDESMESRRKAWRVRIIWLNILFVIRKLLIFQLILSVLGGASWIKRVIGEKNATQNIKSSDRSLFNTLRILTIKLLMNTSEVTSYK